MRWRTNLEITIVKIVDWFLRRSGLVLVVIFVTLFSGGVILKLIYPLMSWRDAYAKHIDFFFAMSNPLLMCNQLAIVFGLFDIVMGWLIIPATIGELLNIYRERMRLLLSLRKALYLVFEGMPDIEKKVDEVMEKILKMLEQLRPGE